MSQADGPCQGGASKEKKKRLGILFTMWWAIWKERNRRVFESKEMSAYQLSCWILNELKQLEASGVLSSYN
jgi:hypothetical protein